MADQDDDDIIGQRDAVAALLDELLQAVSEGTRGGLRRVPTSERLAGSEWSARFAELTSETQASVRMLNAKNVRAAARAKQATKRRGLVKR